MTWKKILAKEIIYLFITIILSLTIYGIVEIKNRFVIENAKELKASFYKSEQKIDSLNKLILSPERKNQLILNLTKLFERGASDDEGDLYSRDFKMKFGEKIIFKKIDSISKEQTKNKIHQAQNRNNFISNDKNGFTAKAILILIIFVYPIRISAILVKWAIKTLKQK